MPTRCFWVPSGNKLYETYHDEEWGVPVHDDYKLFEFLTLEGAQAGLSWETVLKRRHDYHQAFYKFDPAKVALIDANEITAIMQSTNIIKNKAKINSTISNARCFVEVQREFGSFDQYIWSFVGYKPQVHRFNSQDDYPTFTTEAVSLSKDMKKRGFSFVGPTIVYAFMQACGLVDDHTKNCYKGS